MVYKLFRGYSQSKDLKLPLLPALLLLFRFFFCSLSPLPLPSFLPPLVFFLNQDGISLYSCSYRRTHYYPMLASSSQISPCLCFPSVPPTLLELKRLLEESGYFWKGCPVDGWSVPLKCGLPFGISPTLCTHLFVLLSVFFVPSHIVRSVCVLILPPLYPFLHCRPHK